MSINHHPKYAILVDKDGNATQININSVSIHHDPNSFIEIDISGFSETLDQKITTLPNETVEKWFSSLSDQRRKQLIKEYL